MSSSVRPKFDWYETDQQIVLSILVKNMKAEGVSVTFGPRSLAFNYTPEGGSNDQQLVLNLSLAGSISSSESTYRVGTVKAEIKLKKVANFRWGKLEASQDDIQAATALIPPAAPMAAVSGDLNQKAITAITSTQSKLRNWDAQVKELEKEEAEEDNGVEALFRKIYADSSEEVRRAMNKSFQESNGTVLSTNWKEVANGNVEMKPPESSEFKKW